MNIEILDSTTEFLKEVYHSQPSSVGGDTVEHLVADRVLADIREDSLFTSFCPSAYKGVSSNTANEIWDFLEIEEVKYD